jgi:hypothetical protein
MGALYDEKRRGEVMPEFTGRQGNGTCTGKWYNQGVR